MQVRGSRYAQKTYFHPKHKKLFHYVMRIATESVPPAGPPAPSSFSKAPVREVQRAPRYFSKEVSS